MTELLTAAQMRAIEQAAIASGEVTGLELMERAGRGVVEAIFEEWPELSNRSLVPFRRKYRKAVVFCGPGNNGGDGFVVARILAQEHWDVVVYFFGEAERLPPDARANHDRWKSMGDVHAFTDAKSRDPSLYDPHPDLWIDAVFGTGQNQPLPELVTQMWQRVYYEQNWCGAPVVAVDAPTGLASDTGRSVQAFYLTSDLTVTFHRVKLGHVLVDGPNRCGRVTVKDIGLEPWHSQFGTLR
jgi:ADP-dependent NAD(P)H-hydrate dehydratase / NAD(P)H-hydrate epimerase